MRIPEEKYDAVAGAEILHEMVQNALECFINA